MIGDGEGKGGRGRGEGGVGVEGEVRRGERKGKRVEVGIRGQGEG